MGEGVSTWHMLVISYALLPFPLIWSLGKKMVISEPPVSSLMRIKSLFCSWDDLDTYSLPIGQMKKKKTTVYPNVPSAWSWGHSPACGPASRCQLGKFSLRFLSHGLHHALAALFHLALCKQKCLRAGVHTSAYLYILTETKYWSMSSF